MSMGTAAIALRRRLGCGVAGAGVALAATNCRDYTCYDTATCPLGDAGAEMTSGLSDGSVDEADGSPERASNDAGRDAAVDGHGSVSTSTPEQSSADPSESDSQRAETSDVVSAMPQSAVTVATTEEEHSTDEGPTSQGHSSSPAVESDLASGASTSGHDGSSSGTNMDPPGYWRQDGWHGCVWTGMSGESAGTSISPQDFTLGAEGGYCVEGSVAATEGWLDAALLGFNLNQDHETAVCDYVPLDVTTEAPPGVTVTKQGLAVNFIKRGEDKTFTLRAQLWGPNGASDPDKRWCVDIAETQGKKLIPWNEFNTECWAGGDGVAYDGAPISAVTFLVPGNGWPEGTEGTTEDTPFDFCIKGIAAGDSPDDAPGTDTALTGTIGGTGSGADFERVRVSDGGKSYVIQNNNWGNIAGAQSISFVDNSFTVIDGPDGSPSCQGCPLSFPSIYIGASGDTGGGKFHTRSTDNLPAAISALTSVQSRVRWSGNPGPGASASYDIWFAKASRGDLANKRYNDALDGAVMLWLHDPASAQPIGSNQGDVMINGIHWDVWIGPRGQGPSSEGADLHADANAPVISYVARNTTNTFDGDLKPFFDDAVSRSVPFTSELLVTDVFFGFEIWSGGQDLTVDNFDVDVQL